MAEDVRDVVFRDGRRQSWHRSMVSLATFVAFVALAAGCGAGVDGDQTVAAEPASLGSSTVEPTTSTVEVAEAPDDSVADDEGSDGEGTAASAEVDEAADSNGDDASENPNETVIVVRDPGAEPRIQLLLDIADGSTEVLTVITEQTMIQELDGAPFSEIDGLITTSVSDVSVNITEQDLVSVGSVIIDISVAGNMEPGVLDQVNLNMQSMIGFAANGVVDRSGRLVSSAIDGNASIPSELETLASDLVQISNPLPEEPIGVGAIWESRQMISVSGVALEQVATYELLAINGTQLDMAVSLVQVAPPGSLLQTGVGVPAEVIKWTATGSGVTTIDLTKVAPVKSLITVSLEQELALADGVATAVLVQAGEMVTEIFGE